MGKAAIALLLALALFSGCITGRLPAQQITVKKLDLSASNFSELLSLNVPLECAVRTSKGIIFVEAKGGAMRANAGGQALIRQGGLAYIQVPPSRKEEFGCDWVMANESEDVFSQELGNLSPIPEDLYSLPSKDFVCDLAYVDSSLFYPEGKICWYFDLK